MGDEGGGQAAHSLRFQVLGPVWVRRGGQPLRTGSPQQCATLAVLLLHGGRPASIQDLVDALWESDPPARAVGTLRTYVSRLRTLLEPDRQSRGRAALLVSAGTGYALRLPEGALDATEFEDLLGAATRLRAAGDMEGAHARLERALALWEGDTPLAGVPGPYAHRQRGRLTELRVGAQEELFRCALALERHMDTVAELRAFAAEHPLRERTQALLMQALHRSGRRAEALAAYEKTRRTLDSELGVTPGRELAELHLRLLRAAPGPDTAKAPRSVPAPRAAPEPAPRSTAVPQSAAARNGALLGAVRDFVLPAPASTSLPPFPTSPVPAPRRAHQGAPPPPYAHPLGVPAQLPPDISDFTGREAAVAELRDALCATAREGVLPVATLTGLGGVGKTALAVHVAHAVRTRFPDGQLYVDLGGGDGAPIDTSTVLTGFLRALGCSGSAVPDGLEQQAALYRSLLAGRRVLVLLDNARDTAQVRPLLPGTPGCAVLVTSRSRTIALPGARLVGVDAMAHDEALGLLGAVIGRGRIAAEPYAARDLVAACGGLPLAVRIAASRLAARPRRAVADLADRLRDEQRRLDELRVGDLGVDATFQLGYEALDPELARAFRLVALCEMPSFCQGAAAAMLGLSDDDADAVVESLVDAGLVELHGVDRYRYHDLVRLFARRLSEREDTAAERDTARRRFLDYVLATVITAVRRTEPHSILPNLLHRPASEGVHLADAEAARQWLDGAHSRLYVFAERALQSEHSTALAGPAAPAPTALAGSSASAPAPAPDARPSSLRLTVDLLTAWSHLVIGTARHRDLEPLVRLALESARRRGEDLAAARALRLLGAPNYGTQTFARAERALREGLRLAEASGDVLVRAEGAHELGFVLLSMGRAEEALPLLEQAYDRFGELGGDTDRIRILSHMARAHVALGRPADADTALAEALHRSREPGRTDTLAEVLYHAGCALMRDRRAGEAAALLREAQQHNREARNPRWEASSWARLAHCVLDQGRPHEALDCADQALSIAGDLGDSLCRALAQAARGRALLALGDTQRARQELTAAHLVMFHRGTHEATEVAALLSDLDAAPYVPAV